ncbi:translation initiation factor IF-2-like [Triticum dicoccoides]|uniref:translation initiation factor IF-2-like n=1 Tax=Triticum dicoccoides TaxID=85692 RepID=UPI00188F0D24|nr:translation initiation factor IF-2-like [Triticum dicoccoides]
MPASSGELRPRATRPSPFPTRLCPLYHLCPMDLTLAASPAFKRDPPAPAANPTRGTADGAAGVDRKGTGTLPPKAILFPPGSAGSSSSPSVHCAAALRAGAFAAGGAELYGGRRGGAGVVGRPRGGGDGGGTQRGGASVRPQAGVQPAAGKQVTVIHGNLSAFQEEIQSVHHVVRTLDIKLGRLAYTQISRNS